MTNPEEFWYKLLAEKRYYEHCIYVNDYALRFLTRSLNECVVEVQVSAISTIESPSRGLKHKTSEKLIFISRHGPHPLKALNVIEDTVNMDFKKRKWHFVLSHLQYFVSRVVDLHLKEADALPNELA